MAGYIGRRILRAFLTLLGVITLAFFLIRANGNPALLLLGPTADAHDVQVLNHAYGFDQSVFVQYGHYLSHIVRGDFGNSISQQTPAASLVLHRVPATMELAAAAFGFGFGLAVVLSLFAEVTGNSLLRKALLWLGSMRQSIPTFLFGVVMVLAFSIRLRWFPSIGSGGIRHLVLPAVTLGSLELALYFRMLNAALAEELKHDYVRTAYSKGQRRVVVVLRHMLPNAVLPVLTIAGLNLGGLLGGAVIVETVFNWPGAGQLFYTAVSNRDYPVVQTGLLLSAILLIGVNILVDLVYLAIDPRVRHR